MKVTEGLSEHSAVTSLPVVSSNNVVIYEFQGKSSEAQEGPE